MSELVLHGKCGPHRIGYNVSIFSIGMYLPMDNNVQSLLKCLYRSEYDNGRLLRLLLKLGTVNERPDHSGGEWAETGERYILKLFRDYCFHQVSCCFLVHISLGFTV